MKNVYQVWICAAVIAASAARAEDEIRYVQPDGTLPPVVVEPQGSEPSYGGYRPGPYPFGTIPWRSNEITSFQDRVGPYDQPQWTTQRPFATSRVYVLPAGMMQVEQWVRPTYKRHEKPEWRMLEEYAVGLPGRFQLDIYERWNIEPDDNNNEKANHEGVQIELRWALANWNVIPFNPTFYIEWVERGGPQNKSNKYEAKLLLGGQVTQNLFYSSNLIMEQEVEGELENELAWSNALSFPVIDNRLLAGVECNWSGVNVHGARDTRTNEFMIGPSLQLRPTNRLWINAVGLFGTTADAPQCQCYFIMGYQFGSRAGPSSRYSAPVSTIAN